MHKIFNGDGGIAAPFSNYAHAVEASKAARRLYISGQLGVRPDGVTQPDFDSQCRTAFDNIKVLLAEAGMGLEDLVKLTIYLTRRDDIVRFRQIRDEVMGDIRTASTLLLVAGLANPAWLVEIEAVAAT